MARPRLSLLLLLLLCTAGVVTASQEVEDEVADAVEDATPEESPQAAFAHLVFRKVCVCCGTLLVLEVCSSLRAAVQRR